jgi:DNA-binding IclR family transcriptional regulator
MEANPSPYSNSASRAVAIVEFLASQPGQTFSLSEIARRCGLRKSTAYKILGELQASGWLTRWPADLRYGLGPKLVVIGRAASEVTPEVNLARPFLKELAAEFQRECVFCTALSDQILILDSTGPVGFRASSFPPGAQIPLVAPFGAVYIAWQDEVVRKDWYARSGLDEPDRIKQMEETLKQTVKRGYLVTVESDFQDQLAEVMTAMSEDLTVQEIRNLLKHRLASLSTIAWLGGGDTGLAKSLVVESLQAPVFDVDGVSRYALAVVKINREYQYESLSRAGDRVRQAADQVTAAIAAHDHQLEGS